MKTIDPTANIIPVPPELIVFLDVRSAYNASNTGLVKMAAFLEQKR
jgi:hypothetical protein